MRATKGIQQANSNKSELNSFEDRLQPDPMLLTGRAMIAGVWIVIGSIAVILSVTAVGIVGGSHTLQNAKNSIIGDPPLPDGMSKRGQGAVLNDRAPGEASPNDKCNSPTQGPKLFQPKRFDLSGNVSRSGSGPGTYSRARYIPRAHAVKRGGGSVHEADVGAKRYFLGRDLMDMNIMRRVRTQKGGNDAGVVIGREGPIDGVIGRRSCG